MFTLSASRVAAKAVTVRPTRAAKRSVAVKSTKVRATTATRAIDGPAIDPGGDRARARVSRRRACDRPRATMASADVIGNILYRLFASRLGAEGRRGGGGTGELATRDRWGRYPLGD